MRNDVVDAVIEIPLNSHNKYEFDHETGRIRLDRVLYSAMTYPTEYGIIEETLAPDGDPLDILIICKDPTFPGCIVPARILGYLTMCDPRYDNIQSLEDLPEFLLKEISNFFDNYKVLQKITVETGEYHGREDALKIIEECRRAYRDNQQKENVS